MSPVNNISSARLRPIARCTGTIGVEQNSPMLTPGVANRASSDATARSHAATSWQPAAVATPCTFAITGCGHLVQARHHAHAGREQLLVEGLRRGSPSSRRGRGRPRTPAPAPSMTTTRDVGVGGDRVEGVDDFDASTRATARCGDRDDRARGARSAPSAARCVGTPCRLPGTRLGGDDGDEKQYAARP